MKGVAGSILPWNLFDSNEITLFHLLTLVITQAVGGTIVICWTIPAGITFALMIEIFITQAVWGTVRGYGTVTIGITFSIKGLFITVSVNFAIRVSGTVPIVVTGNVGPRPWARGANVN